MGLTVALFATLALATSADAPQDAATWRAQSDALYSQGDFHGALEAAERARLIDPTDPWSRYAWIRALAAVDPDAARREMAGIEDPAALKAFPEEDRARLDTSLGYLCLDLGIEPLAAMFFDDVPDSASSHSKAQAGLAILAVRRGNSRQALDHFDAARATVRQDPSLAELERDARYDVVLHEFTTARDLRDANAAGRAYSVLDELRPSHPSTLQARADLANLRGDMPARERALRDLLAVDPKAPGAATQLVDTLLALNRPYDAFVVAHDMAPERLASDAGLQAIERQWVSHFEAALDGNWRNGQTSTTTDSSCRGCRSAWATSSPRWGRVRVLVEAAYPESDRVPAGEPFGSSVALPAISDAQSDNGIGGLVQWAPRNGLVLELGTTPTSFDVSNLVGALRLRFESDGGVWVVGADRSSVEDSLLSYAGTRRSRRAGRPGAASCATAVTSAARIGDDDFNVYGLVAGAVLDGERVDEQHRVARRRRLPASAPPRATAGSRASAALSSCTASPPTARTSRSGTAAISALSGSCRSGRYSSCRAGATSAASASKAESRGRQCARRAATSSRRMPRCKRRAAIRVTRAIHATASDSGLRASMEWRVTERAVAGIRLEGVRGEDADEVRLQVYARRWGQPDLRARAAAARAAALGRILRPELSAGSVAGLAARHEIVEVLREAVAELRVAQAVFDRRLEVAELAAAIVALALEAVGVNRLVVEQGRNAVGELDLAAGAAAHLLEPLEDRAARGGSGRRPRGRTAPRPASASRPSRRMRENSAEPILGRDDAVAAGLAARHLLHADDAAAGLLVAIAHLREHRLLGVDQVVGEVHEERLVADDRMRAEHGVAEAERRRLADVDAGRVGRQDAAQRVQQVLLALRLRAPPRAPDRCRSGPRSRASNCR